MKIFSTLARIVAPAAVIIPTVRSLYHLFDNSYEIKVDGQPIRLKRVGNGSHPVVSVSPKDAEKLANANLTRMFKEALEENDRIKKSREKLN